MISQVIQNFRGIIGLDSYVGGDRAALLPVFFYHVPRTGGLTFYGAVSRALAYVGGFEDRLGALGVAKIASRLDERIPHRRMYQRHFSFLATHHSYGFHEKFPQSFLLTTVLRDPIERIRSDYTYESMRQKRPVSLDEFRKFYKEEENINRYTKQISGASWMDAPVKTGAWRSAIENLVNRFHTYATTKNLNYIIGYYLSHYRLPNVVMEPLNVTTEQYKLDISSCRDQIQDLNVEDVALYAAVKAQERLPEMTGFGNKTHDHVVVIKSIDSVNAVRTISAGARVAEFTAAARSWHRDQGIPEDFFRGRDILYD